MTNIGIVGSEAAKFRPATELLARQAIRTILLAHDTSGVVSGACHLGGIDVWAVEEARALGIDVLEFPPAKLTWEGGYKQRNIKIAYNSDVVYCITLKELPPTYKGMRFPLCYHCGTNDHVKSGGCWTMKYAIKLGKPGHLIII